MVHFGYGPNTGVTKQTKQEFLKRERNMRELGYALRSQPEARQYANEHDGYIAPYFEAKYKAESEKIKENDEHIR